MAGVFLTHFSVQAVTAWGLMGPIGPMGPMKPILKLLDSRSFGTDVDRCPTTCLMCSSDHYEIIAVHDFFVRDGAEHLADLLRPQADDALGIAGGIVREPPGELVPLAIT